MKKILLLLLIIFCMGCSKMNNNDVVKTFSNKINKSKSYKLNGTMELLNDEEVFNYSIDVSFKADNFYKVEMVNKTNEHKQIILKNTEGLFVITPALNKSFKFESAWPDNSSQAYILSSLIKDVNNDDTRTVKEIKDGYIIKSKVNYPNNDDLQYQEIYIDKEANLKRVEVYGEADLPKIKISFLDIDLNAGLKNEDFELNKYITKNECEQEECPTKETMGEIENIIYPLYMPSNTYLSASDIVNSEGDSRVILTFSGDKNYVIVEETSSVYSEHEIIPVYGEPLMINGNIAALSNNAMYWTANNIDYYIASEDLTVAEMVFIALSLDGSKATIATK